MRVLSNSDYKLFECLVSLSQKEMHKAMAQYLKAKYDNVIFILLESFVDFENFEEYWSCI